MAKVGFQLGVIEFLMNLTGEKYGFPKYSFSLVGKKGECQKIYQVDNILNAGYE